MERLLTKIICVKQFLNMVTKNNESLWLWCLERNINITAQHLPGVLNCIADQESQRMVEQRDWKLNPMIFQKIVRIFGPIQEELLAFRLSALYQVYYSVQPHPHALAMNVFLQNWSAKKGCDNLLWFARRSSITGSTTDTCVEVSTVVPNTSGHGSGLLILQKFQVMITDNLHYLPRYRLQRRITAQ